MIYYKDMSFVVLSLIFVDYELIYNLHDKICMYVQYIFYFDVYRF